MNEGEAAKVLKLMFGDWDPFALREHEHEPDPDTRLMPCGCGGKAVFEGSFLDEEVPSSYRVSLSCIECGISTIAYEYEQEATKAWNTAMGWKGDAELRGGPANED